MAFSEVRRWLSIQDLKRLDCRCLAMFGDDDILRCYIADWAHGFKPEQRYARDLVFTTADIGKGSPLDFWTLTALFWWLIFGERFFSRKGRNERREFEALSVLQRRSGN